MLSIIEEFWRAKSWNWKTSCRTFNFRGPYLSRPIELHFVWPMSGKPHESTFQCLLQIAILSSLEEVMAIFVTVREADRKSEPKASSARSPRGRFALGFRCWFLHSELKVSSSSSPQARPLPKNCKYQGNYSFALNLNCSPIYSYVLFSEKKRLSTQKYSPRLYLS